MEYLGNMTTHVPEGTPGQAVEDVRAREAVRSRELTAQGPPSAAMDIARPRASAGPVAGRRPG